jgi:flagella basal body P-ring formation protein FlgA
MISAWILALTLGLTSGGPAGGTVHVPSDSAVQSPVIRLGAIASFDDLPADVESELAELELGAAATPGQARVFAARALAERIRASAPGIGLSLPERVRVHTAYREIPAAYVKARVEQAIRHRMPWPEDAVRFSRWRLPESFKVAAPAQRFLVHFTPHEDFVGSVPVRIEVIDPERDGFPPVQRGASVELDVQQSVVVSARRLRRGETLEAEALRLELRELRGQPRDVLVELERAVGHRLHRAVPAGTPLTFRHLELERVVKRGDTVVVHAATPGLEMRLEARALEAGAPGQTIRVENPTTRRRFRVEITEAGSGRLSLSAPGGGL